MTTIVTKPGYKQTELGWIPEDWEFSEIGKKIDLLTGHPFSSSSYAKVGVRLLRGSNIKRGNTDWTENITQFWPEVDPKLRHYVLYEGDIVVAMDGSLVGRSFAQLTINDLPALLLQRVARIRSNSIFVGYLKEFVCSDYFTKHCDAVKTSSAIPHISPRDIRIFKIPIPPTIKEQTAIATALSDMDSYIQSLEALIAKKRLIKQGAMQELLTPKEDWEEKCIGDLVSISTGSKNTQDKIEDGAFPFFVRSHTIERINSFSYEGEAVLTAGDGVGTGKIFHYINDKFDLHQRVYIMSDFPESLDGYYFYLYFSENFYDRVMQMTAKSSVDSVRREMIANMRIPLPSIQNQKEISESLREIELEIISLEKKLSKALQIKQGMMQELLTGKIRLV
jgi:type I restriction enzyme S subunit